MGIECDCSYSEDWGEQRLYSAVHRKARKEHKCCECGDPIVPGEPYEYVKAMDGNLWWDCKTCLPCVRIRWRYCSGGWLHEGLAEQIHECIGFDYRYLPDVDESEGEVTR